MIMLNQQCRQEVPKITKLIWNFEFLNKPNRMMRYSNYYSDMEKAITFLMKQCFWTWHRHNYRIKYNFKYS